MPNGLTSGLCCRRLVEKDGHGPMSAERLKEFFTSSGLDVAGRTYLPSTAVESPAGGV
jgi:hypothetical protein